MVSLSSVTINGVFSTNCHLNHLQQLGTHLREPKTREIKQHLHIAKSAVKTMEAVSLFLF